MILLAGLAVVLVLWWGAGAFAALTPGDVVRGLRRVGVGLAIAALLGLVLTGRWGLVLPLALPLIWYRLRSLGGRLWRSGMGAGWTQTGSGGTAASSDSTVSEVRTDFLVMVLDHSTGIMRGAVIAGMFHGRGLESLSPVELGALRVDLLVQDRESIPILDAWLDRHGPADWRSGPAGGGGQRGAGAGYPPSTSGKMTREEALHVLGLPQDCTPEMVREAHRRLMARVHPDHGGTDWLAARLNEARDTLGGP